MRKFFFLIFTSYFLFSIACRPAAAPVSIGNKPVSINDIPVTNQPMPPVKPIEEMSWRTFDGKSLAIGNDQKLKDLRGKVVLLDFWATYCPPCIEAIPHLRQLQEKYGKENLEIIGLHVGGEGDFPKIPQFVEKLKIDYPLATPENELTRFIFGTETAIPQTAIFDRQGKLVKKIVGFNDQIKKDLEETIRNTLAQ